MDKENKLSLNKQIYPFYFVIGALVLYIILYVLPSVIGIYYSFTDWSRWSDSINFVGLKNFKTIFSRNQNYILYITNTLKFTLITTVIKSVLGIAFALLVNRGIKYKNFHRAAIFFPAILSFLVTGLIFRSILHPSMGFLNETLRSLGLEFMAQKWLVDLKWVFKSLMAVDIWKGVGYIMTIYLAGLQSIPDIYYEAAEIDGASNFKKFRHVTLPLLMPAITITTVLNLIYGLRVFDIIYVLTGGGPGYTTEVLYSAVFREFGQGTYAVGNALSTVMVVFMVLIGYFIIRLFRKREVEM
ncbi:MAG: sugar ABC transporter permease [Firmicutes bacterium]|nr:sugar ABC transporter permease [Bacillota bacterium]